MNSAEWKKRDQKCTKGVRKNETISGQMETEKETKSALKKSEKKRPAVHNGKKRPIVQWPALESLNSGRRPTTAAPQDEQQRKVVEGRMRENEREVGINQNN